MKPARWIMLIWMWSLVLGGIDMSSAAVSDRAEDTLMIAQQVFSNECHIEKNCLIEWNVGEDFLSLGLGHFIWYPENTSGIFEESFSAYLQYARHEGALLPEWLDKDPFPSCPWTSREQFIGAKQSVLYQDLLSFLGKTKDVQARFLVGRMKSVLPKVIEAASSDRRAGISRDLLALTHDAQGLYAVVDYVNFKGTGLKNSEHYQGYGWGLLQVLHNMRDVQSAQETLEEFVRSAKEILKRRVANAPVERHEEKWLKGWLRRVDTYLGENSKRE